MKKLLFLLCCGIIKIKNKKLNTEQGYICVSRPRRFGKSMAANMLTAYYSCGCDSRELFQGLKITRHSDFEKHLNRYNVIHLNMRDYLTEAENMQQLIQFIEDDLLDELQQEFLEPVFISVLRAWQHEKS